MSITVTPVFFVNRQYNLDFPKGTTVRKFKEVLSQKENHPVEQILIFHYTVAKADHEELSDRVYYQIHLLRKPPSTELIKKIFPLLEN